MTNRKLYKCRKIRLMRIAKMYTEAKRTVSLPCSFNAENLALSNLVGKVSSAFESLNELEKEFITREFFQNINNFWWINRYPTTTYYRCLNKAVRKFLYAYEKNN